MQRFNHILCVVEPGATPKLAVERAVALAENNQAQLTVVSILEDLPVRSSEDIQGISMSELQAAIMAKQQLELERMVSSMGKNDLIRTKVLTGVAFLALIREVLKQKIDLVIKSAEEKEGFMGKLFGSSDMHLLMEFIWDKYDGVTNYILEVDSNENFTLPRTFGPDLNHQVVNDFVFGTEYFWRVKAQHFLDISDWSEVWKFTTVNTIILESPENGATNVLQCPRYTWEKIDGASRYLLWVDTDESFSNPLQVTADSAFFQCQSSLEKETIYYWKVRGQAGASISDWSEVWSFETEGYDGIEENFDNNVLQMYPNPNNGEFTIQINSLTNDVYEISVVDLVGKELYKLEMNCNVGDNIQKLNLQKLEKGIYLVHLRKGEQTVTKKLFVR